jgi:hypothetical protein
VNHNNKKKNYSNSSPQPKNYSTNYTNDSKASSSKVHGKAPIEDPEHVPNGVGRHCKKEGQYMKDCVEFPKWINVRSKNKFKVLVTFIDESLYLEYSISTWWIDSNTTIHVANSL